jgi:hypothetical protein
MRKTLFVVAVALLATASQAQLFGGKLLPKASDLPKTIHEIQNTCPDTDKVLSYDGNAKANGGPLDFSKEVICSKKNLKLGTLTFQYGAYDAGVGETSTGGGTLMRGGFQLNPACHLKDGYALRWVQYYIETRSSGTGKETIDSSGPAPFYPNHTQAGFDAFFFDAPRDPWTSNLSHIFFETALVCYDTNTKDLFALGSFGWSYDFDGANKKVSGESAFGWGSLTSPFKTTFNSEFGPAGTKGKDWKITDGCNNCFECVPGPSAALGMLIGLAGTYRNRRKRKRNA